MRAGRAWSEMEQSRGLNSIRNAVSGVLKTAVKIVLPFLLRTVILYYLGEEYLGLNSLFYSILQVLNLAELGFSSAVAFRIYKPLAEHDAAKVGAYVNYLRRMYRLIGLGILFAGFIVVPFLPSLIRSGWPSDINIYLLFCVYLINSSISYLFAGYKSVLVIASQRMDYINTIEILLYCLQYVLQFIVVLLFRSYYLYILIMPVITILINIVTSVTADRRFPEYLNKGRLTRDEKKEVLRDIRGVAIYKVSDVTRNSFDSIVISALLGLVPVAVYNNYFYIFNAIFSFMIIVNQSLQASIGNSIAAETREKNGKDLYRLSFFSNWVNVFCTSSLLCLYQPFIRLWVGEGMMLPDRDMILFCVYFYIMNMNSVRNLYFDGNGLWLRGKYAFILESAGNLLLNIFLCRFFGITGILWATILTVFFCGFVWRTKVLFRDYFRASARPFFIMHAKWAALCAVICALTFGVCSLTGDRGIGVLVLRMIICLALPNLILYLLFRRSGQFTEGKAQLVSILQRARKTAGQDKTGKE